MSTGVDVQEFLDASIRFWRTYLEESMTEEEIILASHYIDAYQSARVTLLGEEKEE